MLVNIINFEEIFTIKNIVIYFIAINLFGFFIMWLDKRKAKKGAWRIPEKTLFLIKSYNPGYAPIPRGSPIKKNSIITINQTTAV